MSSTKENKPIPRGIISEIVDIPCPKKNELLDKIKKDLSFLIPGKCLRYELCKHDSLTELQKYISTVCSNYSRKMDYTVKFTVRKIDETSIGIWMSYT